MLSQAVFSGITLGSLYALVGLGFVIIYRATGVVNFAQGEMMMLGAMLGLLFYSHLGLPYLLAFPAAVASVGVFGALTERLAIRPLIFAPQVTLILATVALGQMIRAAVRLVAGSEVSRFPSLFPDRPFSIGDITLTPLSVGIIAIALLLVGGFMGFFRCTRIGKGMEAVAENRDAATLCGVSVGQAFSQIWAASAALAAAAGILLAPLIIITPEMGAIGLKGFIGAVLGGFNSIPGAIAGCFLLGVIENIAGVYVSSSFKDVISYGVLLLVLTLRPDGLFGRASHKRA